jgi:heat shock protein 4
MLDSCEIAGLKCIRLVNENTASALTYGFFRKADLSDKESRLVVFVDFGHSKLTVTFASFLKDKMKIISHTSDRNLGARNIDNALLEKFGEEFFKKHGCDPRNNVRTRLRMLDALEKMRKILSANSEATLNIECLMNDEDVH